MGEKCWNVLKQLNVTLDRNSAIDCIVANGSRCHCSGSITVPITFNDKTQVMDILIVPTVKQDLVLGVDFWAQREIHLNVGQGEWTILESVTLESHTTSDSCEYLTGEQKMRLDESITTHFTKIKPTLGYPKMWFSMVERSFDAYETY
ncbi:hypothetical protein CBL_12126 [Carabus blaptoides fortunei]